MRHGMASETRRVQMTRGKWGKGATLKTKRKKIITAGRLVWGVVYTAPRARDPEHVRQARQKHSTKARQAINMRASYQRLELLLAANFGFTDIHVVLTYREDALPPHYKAAQQCLKKFLTHLREHRRKRGQALRYIYVTEGLHTDGRLHHHLVLNGTGQDLELIRSLWVYGEDVHLETLDTYGGDEALARYLAKEPRQYGRAALGHRMWSSSRGLQKPAVEAGWVEENTTLEAPPDAQILEQRSERNEFGEFVYIKYLMPVYQPRPVRPPRRKKREALAPQPGRCPNE